MTSTFNRQPHSLICRSAPYPAGFVHVAAWQSVPLIRRSAPHPSGCVYVTAWQSVPFSPAVADLVSRWFSLGLYASTMKFTVLILLSLAAFTASAFAIDQTKLDEFKARLETALKAKDMKALNECFYWGDTPQAIIDQAIWGYEENLKRFVFRDVTFQRIDDPKLNPAFCEAYVKGAVMNGRLYAPNLKPEMLCTVTFVEAKDSRSSSGTASPIGVAPDGNVRFTGTHVSQP